MKLGLHVSNFTWPDAADGIGPTFAGTARDADQVILGNAGATGVEKPGYLDRVPHLLRRLGS